MSSRAAGLCIDIIFFWTCESPTRNHDSRLFLGKGEPRVDMKTGHSHSFGDAGSILKKRLGVLLSCAFLLSFLLVARPALAIDASIVIDANTDTVISEENPDRLLHPASMSKLMTLYLAFEALESGRITLQRSFPVSAHAESMSPTKLNLIAGQSIRVEDLILSMVTLSANDSAVVLAEGLGGSEDRFGQLMTRKAHQLGMVNTNFRNSNGLPDPAQISTARDMAILSRALIRHFPGNIVSGTDRPRPNMNTVIVTGRGDPPNKMPNDGDIANHWIWPVAHKDPAILRRILVENPRKLYDFKEA